MFLRHGLAENRKFQAIDYVCSKIRNPKSYRRSVALRACICLNAQVRSNLSCLYLVQRISVQPRRVSKRYFAIACDFRCIEKNKFVYQIRFQSGSIECGPGFQQHVEEIAAAEFS